MIENYRRIYRESMQRTNGAPVPRDRAARAEARAI
jgi:hypothetical protein